MIDVMRAWIELPPGSGWGETRLRRAALERDGYRVEEVRGGTRALLALTGAEGELPGWDRLLPGSG